MSIASENGWDKLECFTFNNKKRFYVGGSVPSPCRDLPQLIDLDKYKDIVKTTCTGDLPNIGFGIHEMYSIPDIYFQ